MSRYLILFLFLHSAPVFADELKPFTTDGCSAFPDGTLLQQSLWANCCIHHDLAYWKGGSYQQRLDADQTLARCVAEVGEPDIAKIMLAGVRVGGSPYFPTFYRWGYGWSYPRNYGLLTNEENQQVRDKITLFKLLIDNISSELDLVESH